MKDRHSVRTHKSWLCLLAILPGILAVPGTLLAASPYPLEYFALRNVINNVQLSPDGKYLALMKIAHRDANAVIEVYDAADLKKEPFRVNADPMEIRNFSWVSGTNFVMTVRQKVRDRIEGFNQGVYETRLVLVDVDDEELHEFDERNADISSVLTNKPNKVILSFDPGDTDNARVAEPFRPRAYYEFDLEKGTKKLILRGKIALGQIEFDGEGRPWLARGFDVSKGDLLWYVRTPDDSDWTEIYRLSEDSFENFSIVGFDESDRNILFVMANNGNDKSGLWEFKIDTRSFGELIYRRSDSDVYGVRRHSNYWTHPDTIVAVAYATDKFHFEYFDEVEEATYKQLHDLIPNAYFLRITSRSRDGQSMTIMNIGPRDPGTYYLLKDSQLQAVGSRQPLLEPERLADVRYIKYKSRDGLTIPAYVTVPNGEPPFPTVVLPHGGPFVQEVVLYDEWGQLLANNGYLVLQPQYRGSLGYGIDFYTSAFLHGGQGGYKMQDDLDDGAQYLVEQGLADPDRLAMFGWSYGGYAALAAASRTPQIYQCVVAGAAVADPILQVNYYRYQLRGAGQVAQLNMWTDSVSPLEEAKKVNVPLMIVHGTVDQRVPEVHAREYMAALDKFGKTYKFVELEGADHFFDTLFYRHQIKLYNSLIGYLKSDCGPGGLLDISSQVADGGS